MIEGQDYYLENGKWVFTAHFLRNRGYCCGSGCRHCPYEEIMKPGEYIWATKDSDLPVTVIGSAGKGPDGRMYAKLANTETAVPVDELKKVNNAPKRSRKPPRQKLL